MIPIHPTPGPDPRTVRWHLPPGTIGVRGPVTTLPEQLAGLVAAGVIAHVVAGEDHLDVTVTETVAWPAVGARIRSALLAGLERPDDWYAVSPRTGPERLDGVDAGPADVGGRETDAELMSAARAVIGGDIGALARSHGGSIRLESVQDGVVTVRMTGACAGCPAAGITLHARLERELSAACPLLREVRAAADGGPRNHPLMQILRRSPE